MDERKIWQPLHPSIRQGLDPQYVAFHDKYMQYVQPDDTKVWDSSARTAPSLPPGGSDPVRVGQSEDLDLGKYSVRVYTPTGECDSEKGWPVLVWFHGGGWAIGGLDDGKDFCTRVCQEARCLVVTVAYRLAPEHRFPCAVEDAIRSVLWVYSQPQELGKIDTSRVSIGGTSAGGNLAITAALAVLSPGSQLPSIKDMPERKVCHPPISLLLIVPVVDNTATVQGIWEAKAETAPWLTPARMEWYRKLYFNTEAERARWDSSPNFAPEALLKKLPRTWIAVAEHDLLRLEAELFGDHIKDLGVNVETCVVPGATHSILALNGKIDRGWQMIEDAANHLKDVFGT